MDTLNSVISMISAGAHYALPMGLSSSPRIFTKVMKPPLAYFRQKGCTVSGYSDDFFIQGNDFRECYSSLEEAVSSSNWDFMSIVRSLCLFPPVLDLPRPSFKFSIHDSDFNSGDERPIGTPLY